MQGKLLQILKFALGWPLTIIALFFIGKIVLSNLYTIDYSVTNINIVFLTLGIIGYLGYFFLRACFWQKLLHFQKHQLSFRETAFLWEITELKRYIPGNIWSLLSRTEIFSGKKIERKLLLSSWFIEGLFLAVGSLTVSIFGANFIIYGVFTALPYKYILAPIITVLILLISLVLIFSPNLFKTQKTKFKLFSFFSPKVNFQLLLIMVAAFVCFSVGTYFSVVSFVYLYPRDFLTFIGFFSFSFFAGYASFIAPMGLGVREGIITIGLSKYLFSLPLAGLAAIVSRLVLIFSEFLFLGISFTWYKSRSTLINGVKNFTKRYWSEIVIAISIAVYVSYFTAITFLKYINFYTGRFDLGNHDQTVWNTLHGHIFQLTDPNGTNVISRLAFHADFILVLLAPFYLIWQDPRMLLLLQTLILAAGTIFVYLLAVKLIGNKALAVIFSLAYLFNPSVEYTNLYDFHGITLATTFLLGSFYFLKSKKYFRYILFLILAVITKEEVWIITAMLGVYTIISTNKKLLGSVIFISSLAMFYYLVFIAIPAARGGGHFALSYYSDFGVTPKEIIRNILLSPSHTITTLFGQKQLLYLLALFFPLGFTSIIGFPFLIFVAPEILADLLSTNSHPHEIYYQYTASLTPFIFISAIYGTAYLHKHFKRIPSTFYNYCLAFTILLSAYLYGPLPIGLNPSMDMIINPQPHADDINNFVNTIPAKFSIAATNNLGSHLSHRQKIFTIPVGLDKADIILFLLNDPYAQPSLQAQKDMVEKMKHDKNYIEIFKLDDFIVFEKRNLYLHAEPDTKKVKLFPLSISALQNRDYAGGNVSIEKTLDEKNKAFASYLVSYPSDGLKIYAVLNIPNQTPPHGFPIIIVNTGYDQSPTYSIETSYKEITDYFAQQGFIVIKPEHRGKGNSDTDTSLPASLALPVDVLNLISSIPTVREANMNNIFLWGHSIGGTATLTALEAYDADRNSINLLRGAAVWAPIIDPYSAYMRIHSQFPTLVAPYSRVVQLFGTQAKNPVLWQSISPLFYIGDINTPLQIVHGVDDTVVPYQNSIELYDDLLSYNKTASLKLFPDDDHNLSISWKSALDENIKFFRSLIR